MIKLEQRFISAGGNRQPNAADWQQDVLAFGSGHNVAIWDASQTDNGGIESLLRGHTDDVNAVRLLRQSPGSRPTIVSGSSDKSVRLWIWHDGRYRQHGFGFHGGSINTISILPGSDIFVAGSADGIVRVWSIGEAASSADNGEAGSETPTGQVGNKLHSLQSITLKPRFLPLATALTKLDHGTILLAVAGTTKIIQLYVQQGDEFSLAASLGGHEGWIRSLDFTRETIDNGSDILLASASQDKYIRLWRIHKGKDLPNTSTASQDPSLGILSRSLSNKPYFIGNGESLHSVTFEALLIGSEDWIFTAQWKLLEDSPELLTTSADNSVSIWKRQADSGYWICETRLGEISSQKGSTTATGSAGGFWIGLRSPDGTQIASLGRTGSWRVWSWDGAEGSWKPHYGITGHVREVKGIAWAGDGSYLLSTGSDQTTRLFSCWKREGQTSWHELARPQIHGYDLNCVATVGQSRFISGADEKLLRVFDMPKASAELLLELTKDVDVAIDQLPESANIPVLGLSNKAVANGPAEEDDEGRGDENEQDNGQADLARSHPPLEDVLARHTLWPEYEKLYGHGYEISTVAASHDHKLVATTCRASSIDHAVIRLYETADWREIKPPLSGHTLTVTSLAFSPDDTKLLSVGRDRSWMIFERDSTTTTDFVLRTSNPKGHSRMILDCTWAPMSVGDVFATAGRDKSVKIWQRSTGEQDYTCKLAIPAALPVTAVSFSSKVGRSGLGTLAFGTEGGEVIVVQVDASSWSIAGQVALEETLRPAGPISGVQWRPGRKNGAVEMLATASEDHSIRLYDVQVDDHE
ncbi:hypothetical protein KVT40_000851 [Elsinoe batatas]|uniref:Elongator complex protein 2 n=1 Tax=Elsinoe batatas TaxID=2601811 RepID=A0A8K0PJ13_9PEZI|nr:hypothetical protein KVT40_000851 [Elsinoe batatas]